MRLAPSIVIASAAALLAAAAEAQIQPREGPKPGTQASALAFKLVPTNASRMIGAVAPREIPLNAIKPSSIRKVPEGTTGARFAILPFGQNADGKPVRYAILITSDSVRIDANANNDLSDDPAVSTQAVTVDGKSRRSGTFQLPLGPEAPPVEIGFSAPDLSGSSRSEPLVVTPNYAMTADASLAGETFMFAIVDGACDGTFAASKNPKAPGGSIIIDRNANGKNDGVGEIFPINQPFNIAGVTYEVRDLDPKAASGRIVVSAKRVDEVNPPSDLRVGSQALSFEAKDMNDKSLNFPGDFNGKVVLLDFWATWCGPCIRELPNVIEAYDKYKDDGFEIVGISLDDDPSKVRAFSRQRSIAWPMVSDGKGWKAEVGQLYRVRSIPAMWLVDGDTGKILATSDTLRGEGALEQAIQAALVVKERAKMKQGGGEGAGGGAAPGSGS
jgi:thiol-disulfide isomerase/thioredoxin